MRGFLRRHRTAIATNTALVVAAGAVLAYAISADGYRAHQTELNDGGIWVTKSDKGYFGRENKPIGRLDGAIYLEDDADLDVVQDGAAVVGINGRAERLVALDPATLDASQGASATLPEGGSVQMRGGSLATIDPATGATRAVRYEAQTGDPLISAVDAQSDPLAAVGKQATMVVTAGGKVVVASADKDRLAIWDPTGLDFAKPTTEPLPEGAQTPTSMTSVGETPVLLDQESGALAIRDGRPASLAPGGTLQQPGPAADSVLVAHGDGLTEVDLATTGSSVLVEGVSGVPAAPVRLGACVYGAWSGGTGYVAVGCGGQEPTVTELKGDATDLVFRVNRGEIVLNDIASGSVWNIDAQKPLRIDNWEAFTNTKKVEKQEKDDQQETTGDRRPPQAKPDEFGARPGRTSVLYPLDNDAAPEGRLLAIQGVDQPNIPGARVAISPDRQTLQLTMPENARGQATFDYYIDDGRNLKDQATVSVQVRGSQENTPPALRDGNEPRLWRVPAGGSIEIPVLPDWRDPNDSDPLLLESARVASGVPGAVARATTNGRLRLTAPGSGGEVQVEYAVSDGISEPIQQTINFTVQDKFEQVTYPATAEPDVISGEVGKPIIIRPLANDLPGSDPSTPNAQIELEGRIPDQAGVRVRTDTNSGVVRVDASKAGTYLLDYQAGYGNAKLARGKMRVDVRPPPKNPEDPVATPDTLTLYGQAAATVDVLANDVDPAGGILVVQEARADRPDQMDVSIVEGRWLRISAREGELNPRSQVVRYTISNGASSGVDGEVLVIQRPRPKDNTPVTGPDRAVVRAGSGVAFPVLDNDFSPSGDRLDLASDAADGVAGELTVEGPQDYSGDLGSAYVSGRTIRYIAPAGLKERESFTVPYVAVNSTGESSPGTMTVVVVPDRGSNTAPEAPTLEGRLVAGDSLRIRLPGSGVDPDGDPVVITGIASAPRLGRLLEYGANSMEFQAFPNSVGTEEFSYTLADSRGAESTGLVRVAVVPPGPPQPPVAVPDSITVAPGATARLDVLSNDEIGSAERVTIELIDAPPGVSLDSDIGPILIKAPAEAKADTVEVVYSLSNGIDASRTTARLEVSEGFNNPPIVQDAFGRADDSDAVTVDLLAADSDRPAAYDPDGEVKALSVTRVYADEETFRLSGNTLTVRRGAAPAVVPFRVEDAAGGTATASLYVPATGSGRPYLKPNAQIEFDSGDSFSFNVKDYIVNPAGGGLTLTGRKQVWASPRPAMSARGTSETEVEVAARSGFRGPAAVLVEVVPALEEGQEQASEPTIISIPVQVGTDKPELDCPDTPIEVAASDSVQIDIPSVCYVWTLDPAEKFSLDYAVGWATTQPEGLSFSSDGGPVVSVVAEGATKAGSRAELTVRAGSSEPETLQLVVVKAPSPSMLSVTVPDMQPGDSREIDLSRYLKAGVSDPVPTILDVSRVSGSSVNATSSGANLRLSAPKGAEGRSEFKIEMSDVAGNPGPERRVSARISIEVLDKPTVPGAPAPIAIQDRSVKLSWAPSQPQGARIDHYEVKTTKGGLSQRFRTNGGRFTVPANGKSYSFRVRAHNKVGYSEWSDESISATVDTIPNRVRSIRASNPGDGTLTLNWTAPSGGSSAIQMYYITWRDGSAEVPGDRTSQVIQGLNNNLLYDFSIRARNKTGTSEARLSDKFQSVGTPLPPGGLRLEDLQAGTAATTVRLDWSGTLPEGPGPTTYTIQASAGKGPMTTVPGCSRIEVTSCRHTGIPYDGRAWSYTVLAHNAPGNTSAPSAPISFLAVGMPDPWSAWRWTPTGRDNEIVIDYTVPLARGSKSEVTVLVNGVESQRNQETGARSRTIALPNNLNPHSVQLRVCNENAVRAGCSTSAIQDAQSYGPLPGSLGNVRAVVTGDTIQWVVEGSSNGNPAKLDLAVYDGGSYQQSFQVDLSGRGPGAFSYVTPPVKVGWRSTQKIEVRLYDDAPGGRGQAEDVKFASTGEPPVPEITISKVDCTPEQQEDVGEGCGAVHLLVTGFFTSYRCDVVRRGVWGDRRRLDSVGPNNGTLDFRTAAATSGGTIEVQCDSQDQSDKVRQSSSNSAAW